MSQDGQITGRVTPQGRAAQQWAITGWDDPVDARLVLSTDDGEALSVPLDDALVDAVIEVAQGWATDSSAAPAATATAPAEEHPYGDDLDDPDRDERRSVTGQLSRVTGWHQVDRLVDGMSEGARRVLAVAVVVALLLLVLATIW